MCFTFHISAKNMKIKLTKELIPASNGVKPPKKSYFFYKNTYKFLIDYYDQSSKTLVVNQKFTSIFIKNCFFIILTLFKPCNISYKTFLKGNCKKRNLLSYSQYANKNQGCISWLSSLSLIKYFCSTLSA